MKTNNSRIIALKLSHTSSGTGINNTVEPSSSSEQYSGPHVNGNGQGQGFPTHLLVVVFLLIYTF